MGQKKSTAKREENEKLDLNERLFWAAYHGDEPNVRILLSQGADIEYADEILGQTPVLVAAFCGRLRVVKTLVSLGADVKKKDSTGINILQLASVNDSVELLNYLVEMGMNVHDIDLVGDNCLHFACRGGHLSVIKWLIEHGLSLNTPNMEGKTPLDCLKEDNDDDDDITQRKHESLKALENDAKPPVVSVHSTNYPMSAEAIELKKMKIENRMSEPHFKRSQGIIFIVGIYGADGTAKDVENVENTFRELNFTTYTERDPTTAEIALLVKATAQCDYPYRYRYVAFYYAGHGGMDESGKLFVKPLQLHESKPEMLHIEEYIIEPLNSLQLTRLFFFDCCQTESKATTYYSARDSGLIMKKPKPHPGTLIAYATSEGQKSFGDRTDGGIWTYNLCKNLKKDLPLVTILAETYEDVVKTREEFQEPMTITKIGALKL